MGYLAIRTVAPSFVLSQFSSILVIAYHCPLKINCDIIFTSSTLDNESQSHGHHWTVEKNAYRLQVFGIATQE